VLLTEDLAFRLERAAVAWGRAWMEGIAGLDLGDFAPHVLAPCHPARPDLDFQNRVNGLTPADAHLVPSIVAWYGERGVRPWFELVPHNDAGDLLAALTAAGAVPIGFHGVVYGPVAPGPDPTDASDVDVSVVDLDDDAAFATFCRTRVEAHELPAEIADRAAADLAGWRRAAGATLYLATIAGEPAATAALTVGDDGVAYLADGATLPAFRGRGIQSRLIRRRLDGAAAAGATVAGSQASFATTSHRNLQRAGLVGGFTKVVLRVAGP
jgi:GNAT superfamily N-acetyltransferase